MFLLFQRTGFARVARPIVAERMYDDLGIFLSRLRLLMIEIDYSSRSDYCRLAPTNVR